MLENVIASLMNRRDFLKLIIASSVFGCGDGNGGRIFNAPSEGPFSIFDYFPLTKGSRWRYTHNWENEVITFYEEGNRKEITYGPRKFQSKYETYFVKGDELFLHSDGITSYFDPDVLVGNSNIDLGDNFATNFDLYVQGLAGITESGIIEKFVKTGTGVISWRYMSLEDVKVPAGLFKNCLRVEATNNQSLFGGFIKGGSVDTYWLAKGVGRVKHISSSLQRVFELEDYEIR